MWTLFWALSLSLFSPLVRSLDSQTNLSKELTSTCDQYDGNSTGCLAISRCTYTPMEECVLSDSFLDEVWSDKSCEMILRLPEITQKAITVDMVRSGDLDAFSLTQTRPLCSLLQLDEYQKVLSLTLGKKSVSLLEQLLYNSQGFIPSVENIDQPPSHILPVHTPSHNLSDGIKAPIYTSASGFLSVLPSSNPIRSSLSSSSPSSSIYPDEKIKVGINGFGRIGRIFLRNSLARDDMKVVHINCSMSPDYMAYLLRYDSVHGQFGGSIEVLKNGLKINGDLITLSSTRNPHEIPWGDSGVEYVVESTGNFLTTEEGMKHIDRPDGAKKVVISAPSKDEVTPTLVYGINAENDYKSDQHHVISSASCTTNCLAPLVKVLDENYGITEGLMTTVHAATGTQKVVDSTSKKDWRGGRAAGANIIPSSTGAAKAVGRCMPNMIGKLTGMSFRVPTQDVSVVDLTVRLKTPTTYENIKEAMKKASKNELRGVLDYTEVPIVSQDIVGSKFSSIFDANAGIMLNPQFVKVVSWYDNEYGYSARLTDLIALMASKDKQQIKKYSNIKDTVSL